MKNQKAIKFGFCIPIFANPGMLFFRTPAYKKLDWNSIREAVIKCEGLGYDSLFVADHLFLGRDGEIWECLATMAALAAVTKNMLIAPIHLCNNFRQPGLVAKALATISHISNGRVILFYDYGWRKAEFEAYGIDFGKSDDERIEQQSEGLIIIKGLLEKENFSFAGKYYKIKDAICNPKPVKPIPLWLGEANNQKMITDIVKYADVFNSMPCSPDAFQDKRNIIEKECEKQGRDFKELGLALETQVLIRKTNDEIEEELRNYSDLIKHNNSFDSDILAQLKSTNPNSTDYNQPANLKKEFLIGTPEEIKGKLDLYISQGVNHFMLWFMDYPDFHGLNLFAKEIFPFYK